MVTLLKHSLHAQDKSSTGHFLLSGKQVTITKQYCTLSSTVSFSPVLTSDSSPLCMYSSISCCFSTWFSASRAWILHSISLNCIQSCSISLLFLVIFAMQEGCGSCRDTKGRIISISSHVSMNFIVPYFSLLGSLYLLLQVIKHWRWRIQGYISP